MRKVISVIGFGIVMVSALCSAAESEPDFVKMGIQGGLSFASASTPADMSTSSQTGFLAGINVNARITNMISLQPELMFAQRKSSLVNTSGFKLTAKYNSIELPVLAKVSFGEGVRPYVFAGPVAILNVSNEFETQGAGATGGITFQPRTFDFAADFGAGIDAGPVFANLRYSLGLVDYDRSHVDWKSNGLKMLLGLYL